MFSSLLSFSDLLKATKQFFVNFDGLENASRCTLLWIAIAAVLVFVVLKFALKPEQQKLVNRIFALFTLLYALTVIVLSTVIYFVVDVGEDGAFVPITYYPLMVFALVVAISVVALLVKPLKPVKIAAYSAMGAALVAVIVCLIVYSVTGEADDYLAAGQSASLYVAAAALVAIIVCTAFFTDRNSKPYDSRSLAFAAVCVAMSFALSYVRFFKMPFGGSITFASLLPLMLYSYMFGTRKGVLAGLVCGILQSVQDPWIVHPAQFLLDYPVAFAGIGLAGSLKSLKVFDGKPRLQFSLGAAIGGAARFMSHFFSGALAFGSYGVGAAEKFGIPALSNPYFYSFVYQCTYVIPDLLIVIVVGILLFSSKSFNSQVERYSLMSSKLSKSAPKEEQTNTEAE